MRVLVTGATGFIGQNLIPLLLADGDEVIATSRTKEKAEKFCWFKKIHYIEADLYQNIENPFEYFNKPETLIHLAWQGLPNYSEGYHFEKNLYLDYMFLKNIIESGLTNLLVTGTCFEYGNKCGSLLEESETSPQNSYALAKDTLCRFLFELKKKQKFNLIWGRLFYLYGEGQPKSSLYPLLKEAVAKGDKTFRMSGGEQLRDYLHVIDAARLIVQLIQLNSDLGVLNICSGKPISVRRLVEQWREENGWDIELDLGYYPYPDHEPMAFWGNRNRLDRCLNGSRDKELFVTT